MRMYVAVSALLALAVWGGESGERACVWERLGVDGGGYIGRIVVDASRPERVYCLSDKGGIHRSEDGGQTWEMKNRGFFRETHYGVSDLVQDPRCPERLLAATGNAPWAWRFWYPGAVMRSDDGGESWREVKTLGFPGEGEPGKGFGGRLAFDGAGVLYAASFHQGLWRSPDAGDTWEQVGLGDRFLTSVLTDSERQGRLLVSARCLPQESSRQGGLLLSEDAGRTWRTVLEGNVLGLERAPYRPDWLLANAESGIHFSSDRGLTWRRLPVRPEMTRFNQVRFQTGREPRIWATSPGEGARLYYTDDFGQRWEQPPRGSARRWSILPTGT
ncbi:MAG: WD40/YVTN/BNR-like repeat-containing protein [Oligosphaeraceae bacterium]